MNLRYKTKIDIFQTLILTIELVVVLIFGISILLKNIHKANGLMLFGIGAIIICVIQIMRVVKRFDLYDETLIITRPLSMTSKTDTVLKLNDIKEIIFRNISGRFGGPVIIIDSAVMTETYNMNFSKNDIDQFELELNNLGVKTIRDNI